MNIGIKKTVLISSVCIVAVLAISCSVTKPVPDSAIQEQITKAGMALLKIPGDTTKNYVKDLKGDKVPVEVRSLEKMLKGDRIRILRQLVSYLAEAGSLLPDQKQYEQRGWCTLILVAYFNYTPEEVENVAKQMPSTEKIKKVTDTIMTQAKANHSKKDSK